MRSTPPATRWCGKVLSLTLAIWTSGAGVSHAQTAPNDQVSPVAAMLAATAERTSQTATLTYFNRDILVLRARVLGREPDERARSAERVLGDLVAHGVTGPVAAQPLTGGMLITVGSRVVLGVS